jgi:hypothetical protein
MSITQKMIGAMAYFGKRSLLTILDKLFPIKQDLQIGSSNIMRMVMENEYLSPFGYITKKQRIEALLERTLEKPISSWAIGTRYKWKDVNFQLENQDGVADSIKWTFAHDQEFRYFKAFRDPIKDNNIRSLKNTFFDGAEEDMDVTKWFSSCPGTPATNLMMMMNWDVLTFEELGTRISGMAVEGFINDDVREMTSLGGTYVQLGLRGCKPEQSFFKNGKFYVKPIGYNQIHSIPIRQYEYRSQGILHVRADSETKHSEQSGNSFFFGKIFINCNTSDLVYGDLVEIITASIVKGNGSIIPVQKRRFVHLTRV